MKKTFLIIFCTVLCAFLLSTAAFARNGGMMEGVREGVREAESTAKDMLEDAATDIEGLTTDMMDPENGEPLAEEDGIVDKGDENRETDKNDETRDETKDETKKDTTDEMPSTDRDTDSKGDDTTGVIDGMELDKKGINPWAIVIAVVVVIAVLVLIFVLIPKRRR